MLSQFIWTNATNDGLFSTAGNWDDTVYHVTGVPGASDYALFGCGGSNTNCTFDIGSHTVDRIIMDSGYTATFTIQSGKTLTTDNHFVQYGTLNLAGTAVINVGTWMDVNGAVVTSGASNLTATIDAGGSFYNNGTITASGMAAKLDITSSGFDDGGTLNAGSTGMSGTLTINGPYVQAPAAVINVIGGGTLNFLQDGASEVPTLEGTTYLRGTITTDSRLDLSGGTLNSVSSTNTIAGDVGVHNGGTINIGTSGGSTVSTLELTTGDLTIGAPTAASSSPTGGDLNIQKNSTLSFPSAASATTFVVKSLGVINMYGATITMDVSRVAQLEIREGEIDPYDPLEGRGQLNSYGASGFPTTGDTINGNVVNNGEINFGGDLHTLLISAFGGSGGDFTQGTYGELSMRLNNSSACDLLSVGDDATLDGRLTLAALASLNAPQTWTIITISDTRTGNFATVNFPADGGTWTALPGSLYTVTKSAS